MHNHDQPMGYNLRWRISHGITYDLVLSCISLIKSCWFTWYLPKYFTAYTLQVPFIFCQYAQRLWSNFANPGLQFNNSTLKKQKMFNRCLTSTSVVTSCNKQNLFHVCIHSIQLIVHGWTHVYTPVAWRHTCNANTEQVSIAFMWCHNQSTSETRD